MEKININGVPQEISVTLTQSAKGLITIDKLTITANSEVELLEKLDSLMPEILQRLKDTNVVMKDG